MKKLKLVIFDLDGVLLDAKNIHFDALNDALGEKYKIEWDEHLSIYDGLKTFQKLEMLSIRKDLPVSNHKKIWETKQKYTLERLRDVKPSKSLQILMESLVNDGYKIAICSNSNIFVCFGSSLWNSGLNSLINVLF